MESRDSPEIPDREETSDIPGLPLGGGGGGGGKEKREKKEEGRRKRDFSGKAE